MRVRALRRRWKQQLGRDLLYTSTRGCNSARRGARRGRPLPCVCCVSFQPAAQRSAQCCRHQPSLALSSSSVSSPGRRMPQAAAAAAGLPPPRITSCSTSAAKNLQRTPSQQSVKVETKSRQLQVLQASVVWCALPTCEPRGLPWPAQAGVRRRRRLSWAARTRSVQCTTAAATSAQA